jgi:predicted nucleic acid-binding protein
VIYTLDTNVLVDALRQPAELDRLRTFLDWALPSTVLSSIVVAELTLGAPHPKAREALERQFLAHFERRGRIFAPSAGAWRRAGNAIGTTNPLTAKHLADVLLASQAREFGWTIITRDRDFSAIRRAITGLRVATPYPPPPAD